MLIGNMYSQLATRWEKIKAENGSNFIVINMNSIYNIHVYSSTYRVIQEKLLRKNIKLLNLFK